MVVERMLAGHFPLRDTLHPNERANAGPGEMDDIEGRVWECGTGLRLEIPNVIVRRVRRGRITLIVRVGRADDRVVPPRDHKEQPTVALGKEHVGLLGRARRDDVDPLGEAQQGPPGGAKRRQGLIEPRAGRVHGVAGADLELAPTHGIVHPRAGHPVGFPQESGGLRMIQHEGAVRRGVDRVLDDEPLDERHLRVVEAPGTGEIGGVEPWLGRKRVVTPEPFPLGQALVE